MRVEHRRQLLAFFVVALVAVLLTGNAIYGNQSGPGRARTPAAITAGVTISPGQWNIGLGGSARGTTAEPPASPGPGTAVQSSGRTPTAGAPARTTTRRAHRAQKALGTAHRAAAAKRTRQHAALRQAEAAFTSYVLRAYRTQVATRGTGTQGAHHAAKTHAKAHHRRHRHQTRSHRHNGRH
jgi:hypothetical protein